MIRKNKKYLLLVIGTFLIISSITLFFLKEIRYQKIDSIEKDKVDKYIEKVDDVSIEDNPSSEINQNKDYYDYIGIIEIPNLNIKRGLVDKDSIYNDVNYNVQILNESSMPDKEKGNLILAAHSGNTRVSFFRNLKNISLDDNVFIYYKYKKYTYKVVKTYFIDKIGYANIVRDKSKTTLTLITCKSGTNYQLVVICELIESE